MRSQRRVCAEGEGRGEFLSFASDTTQYIVCTNHNDKDSTKTGLSKSSEQYHSESHEKSGEYPIKKAETLLRRLGLV